MNKKNDSKIEYIPTEIEAKWQKKWGESKLYSPDMDKAKKPFYNLMMFPYPSAEGLHVGNMYAFVGSDIYGRFQRMQGFDVFEPIGLDGFGIHSENYALKIGKHPMEQAEISQKNFYRQLKATGNAYDWDRTVETYDPDYYKWTQWLFIQLFKKGLAYRKNSPVNFCPSCKTVLADEQVIDGKCERCSSVVEKRDMEQWFFKITEYADRLLNNIPELNWTEKVKIAQKEWIGRSKGVHLEFKIQNSKDTFKVFTTAIDTVFGVTFVVISPEHSLLANLVSEEQKEAVGKYVQDAQNKSEIERTAEGKDKTGVFTGSYAINPFTGQEIPIWVADYVLMGYGTGVVMGVPGHDARDHEFAQKFKLEIKSVIRPKGKAIGKAHVDKDGFWNYATEIKGQFKDDSELYNSGKYDGMTSKEAKEAMEKDIEADGFGEKVVNYHLRDWLISRQRYWGPPIPMIYCEKCGWQSVPEDQLPVLLPKIDDYKPLGTGKAPLASHPEFYETTCPNCKGPAKRETDVSDTFLDSAWYFFRYISTDIQNEVFDTLRGRKWLPVDMYIGGAEHSVLHLLYTRFITMVLSDLGKISFEEPFKRFYAHGLIIKEGAKMSKSKGNVVVPDEYIKKFGADTLRLYLMFLGPYNQGGDFRDSGIEGMGRFVKRVWTLLAQTKNSSIRQAQDFGKLKTQSQGQSRELDRLMHKTIKKVTDDIASLRYNTAIAALMEYYNGISDYYTKYEILDTKYCKTLVLLLAPFAPHLTEELWQQLGNEYSIHVQNLPAYDASYLVSDEATVVIQVNGKLRSSIKYQVSSIKNKDEVQKIAEKDERVARYLEGKKVVKVIYVEGKVINFVVQ